MDAIGNDIIVPAKVIMTAVMGIPKLFYLRPRCWCNCKYIKIVKGWVSIR